MLKKNKYLVTGVDLSKLIQGIDYVVNKKNLSPEDEDAFISNLGKLLLNEKYEISKEKPVAFGLDPTDMLKWTIIKAYVTLKNKNALKFLSEFYVMNGGDEGYCDLKNAIKSLGGEVPELPRKTSVEKKQELTPDDKAKIEKAITIINTKTIKKGGLSEAVEVLAKYKINSQNQRIIERLKSKDTHWIDVQNCIYYLSQIGGREVLDFAKYILSKPVPADAKLDDDDADNILRSYSVDAICKLGGVDDIKILEEHVDQKNEYDRVKSKCKENIESMKEKFKIGDSKSEE